MPSPFPGMNPYLEQDDVWHDFHKSFISRFSEVIDGQLKEGRFSRIEPRFPGTCGQLVDEERQSRVMIRDRGRLEAITAIELLSPGLKRSGTNQNRYLEWRTALRKTSTNLVEIDLLRGGQRLFAHRCPPCDYCVWLSRVKDRIRVELWPVRLRDALPKIPIPLLQGESDAVIDLQAQIHAIHDAAGYKTWIYSGRPDPPLSPADALWAKELLGKSDWKDSS